VEANKMAGPYELQSPKDIAMEYGGNKQKIAQAAQMGLVDPTSAVLAGMFIDKMRMAQQEEMAPQSTVAQDVMAAPAGLGATPQAAMAPQMPQQMPTEAGVAALPVPDEMVPDEYAGGGIVAFSNGGATEMFGNIGGGRMPDPNVLRAYQAASGARMPRKELVDLMNLAELQEYNRTGKIPARLAQQVQGRAIEGVPMFGSGIYGNMTEAPPVAAPAVDQTSSEANRLLAANTAAATAPVTPPAAPPTQPGLGSLSTATKGPGDLSSFISQIEGLMPKGEAFSGLEKDIQADREARKAEKSQAGWMRLAEAGFNIAAGTSPYALANIGKGASEALKGYADDLKEQKKLDREDKKLLADIEKARREEKRGNITAALGSYEKALDRASGDTRARIAAEASRYAADKESPQVQLINTYARAKNIPFDQALREVATAQAEGKDPLLGMIQSRVAGGTNRADILKALEDKFGPLQPTR